MKYILVAAALCLTSTPVFAAKYVERACINSNKRPARSTCSCIQRVANQDLSRRDQKVAAKIFKQPDLYMSYKAGSSSQKAFAKRYYNWAENAGAYCR